MTRIHGGASPDQDSIHAILIGVGRYKDHELRTGLSDLSSPGVSTTELARWMLKAPLGTQNLPLGSVELLLSPTEGQDLGQRPWANDIDDIDAATTDNILQALGKWRERCDERPGNVALFYFCGHGYQKSDLVLLPTDFGSNKFNKWNHALNFTQIYQGMATCKATKQFYWIDACRNHNRALLREADFGGRSPFGSQFLQRRRRSAPQLLATTEGFQAHGEANSVSRFTAALIEALGGAGADKQGLGGWEVTADSLGEAVIEMLKRGSQNLPVSRQQFADVDGARGDDFAIHEVDGAPEVDVHIRFLDPELNQTGVIYLRRGALQIPNPAPPGPFQQRVKAAVYDVHVNADDETVHEGIVVFPPYFEDTV